MLRSYKYLVAEQSHEILWGAMAWLEDRIMESKALKARTQQITEAAVEIYESLWAQLKELVDDAKAKSYPLSTNGMPEDRIIWLSVEVPPHQAGSRPKELHVKLAKDKLSIKASGGGVDVTLEFDICDDGVVCLKSGGNQISIRDAGIKILDPFLFPELPRKY